MINTSECKKLNRKKQIKTWRESGEKNVLKPIAIKKEVEMKVSDLVKKYNLKVFCRP
jgi:hypothetical protein